MVLVRFKSKFTMLIYLVAEVICLGSFSLMFLYQNEQQATKTFSTNITDGTIDYVIIVFISAGMLFIMTVVIIEAVVSCIRMRRQGKYSSQTAAKPPRSSRDRHLVEERKDSESNLDILKPQQNKDIMDVKEFNQVDIGVGDESYVSKHTVTPIASNNPTQSNLTYNDIVISKYKGSIEEYMPKRSEFDKKAIIVSEDPSNL